MQNEVMTRSADTETGESRHETPDERHDRNWDEVLQELRVTLTGTQIISGFLLALAFQQRFTELSDAQLGFYLVLVGFAGLSTALGLAPVVLHRTFFQKHVKSRVVTIGNRLLLAEIVVVGVLAVGVTSFVFDFVIGTTAGIAAGVVATMIVVVLWVLLPHVRRAD